MTQNYVSLWGWFHTFGRNAHLTGDSERIRLFRLNEEVWKNREKSPEYSYRLCEQGAELARRLQEPCMELFYEYWATEMLLFYMDRTEEGLAYAVKIATKASQERYLECPVRGRVYITLISAYYHADVLGYEREIWDMIDYMEREIPMDDDTHWRLQAYRGRIYVELNDNDKAEAATLKYLELSTGTAFRENDAYQLLTLLAYYRHDNQKGLQYALLYEIKARSAGSILSEASSLLWQALFYRKQGDEESAHKVLKRGISRYEEGESGDHSGYYDQLCRFYEAGKEYDKSLSIRDKQLAEIKVGIGGRDLAFHAHRKRCILLKMMGKLTDADIEMARVATTQLKNPERHLVRLKEIQQKSADQLTY